MGGSLWNRVASNNYRSKVIFEFRFGGRHLESAVNYVIEVVMTRSAVVENVGV